MVHVWWARPSMAGPRLQHLLDPLERRRLAGLARQSDRDRFVAGCGILRLLLSGYLDQPPESVVIVRTCRTCGGPHGKPRLTGSSRLRLSLAHAGGRLVIAVALGHRVGVDVEPVRPDLAVGELTGQALTPGEAAELARSGGGAHPAERFLTYWTRKEATLKAIGLGLVVPLRSFRVSGPGEPPRITAWPAAPGLARRISLHDLGPGAGHVASLAVAGACRQVVEREFVADG
jgi:4'-phosphopantetheinyl transferase